MTFLWPTMLLLLAAVPVGVWAYREIGRRRWRRAGSLAGLRSGADQRAQPARLRARIPAAMFVLGLVVMVIALARPQGTVGLPLERGTVILAMDVSGSMAATDLQPTRMAAAKAATTVFVEHQPPGIAIGVVAFSDSGLSVQVPTTDQAEVLAAINRLAPQRGTSLGQGILASLDTIATFEAGSATDYYTNRSPAPSPTPTPPPVPPGSHGSALIVLLTDGENNESPDPLAAAQTAADRGIPIDTVGIGSEAGADLDLEGFRVHTQLNAQLLQQIASTTAGTYYSAESAADLEAVYASLDPQLVIAPQEVELTSVLAGISLLLMVGGGAASLAWLGRLP